jgi:hypothetical protein
MARYGIARVTTDVTNGEVSMDVANSTGVQYVLREWAITLRAATASDYEINRPTTLGTRTTPTAIVGLHDGLPALTGITLIDTALAHSAQPSLGAVSIKRAQLPATIGAGRVWRFDEGMRAAISLSLALVNRATNGALNSEIEGDV